MKKVKRTSEKNLKRRAKRFVEYVLDAEHDPSQACEAFDRMLDDLLGADYFGTEGQNDPRGDRRG